MGDPTEAGALASVARCSVGGDDGGRRQGECGPLRGGLRSARHAAGVAVVVRAARVWQRASAAIEPFGEGAARLIVRSAGAANAGGAKRVHRRARGELVRLLRARAAACERAAARDGAGGGRDARGARGRAVRRGGGERRCSRFTRVLGRQYSMCAIKSFIKDAPPPCLPYCGRQRRSRGCYTPHRHQTVTGSSPFLQP